MVPNTKNFVFHCKKSIGTYVRWIGQCLVHGTRPSSSHLWAHQAQGAPGNWNDILGHTKEWIAVVCNKMMKFDGLKLSRMEIVTSGVEAHQACAIVIMSPHGFSGSPYLPGKKSPSFKCVKNACILWHNLCFDCWFNILPRPECSTEEKEKTRSKLGRVPSCVKSVVKVEVIKRKWEGKINMSKG